MEINIALATVLAVLVGVIVDAIRLAVDPPSRWIPVVALAVGAVGGGVAGAQTGAKAEQDHDAVSRGMPCCIECHQQAAKLRPPKNLCRLPLHVVLPFSRNILL